MVFTPWRKLKFEDPEFSLYPNGVKVAWVEKSKDGIYSYRDSRGESCKVNMYGTYKILWLYGIDRMEVELDTCLCIWPDSLYGPIFLYPEFPHLTRGRQESAHCSARSRGGLLEIRE